MNYFYLAAGLVSLSACIGHFTMGVNSFLKPVIDSDVEIIAKKTMHSLFHYMSAYMILTSVLLLSFAFGESLFFGSPDDVAVFISLSYIGFALAQLYVALTSGIKGSTSKLFQWMFWLLIAVLAFRGAGVALCLKCLI